MLPSIEQLGKYLFELEHDFPPFESVENKQIWYTKAAALLGRLKAESKEGIYRIKSQNENKEFELIAYLTEWEEFTYLVSELEKSLKIHEAQPYLSRSSSEFYNQREIIKASKRMVDIYYQELYHLGQIMIEHLRAISLVLQTQYGEGVTHNMKKAILDRVIFPLIEGGIDKIRSIQKNGVRKYDWLQNPKDLWKAPYPVAYLIDQVKALKLQLNRQHSELVEENLDDIPM